MSSACRLKYRVGLTAKFAMDHIDTERFLNGLDDVGITSLTKVPLPFEATRPGWLST